MLWTLIFNMLTEACRVWVIALGFFLESLWALYGLTLGWICLDVHSVLNVFHSLFGNVHIILPRMMGDGDFSNLTADVFLPLRCVNAHVNVPDRQAVKNFRFHRGGHTSWWRTNQGHWISGTWRLLPLFIPVEAVRVYWIFSHCLSTWASLLWNLL